MRYICNQEFYNIESVKMECYDNTNTFQSIPMKYDKTECYWFCESDAEIVRYKFVINDILRLNDPNAGSYMEDENWEVWSVAGEGNGIEPKLSYFNISDNMTRGITKAIKKAAYMLLRPLDIFTGVGICQVKGLHSVTYICFQPDGSIYKLEESSIGQFEANEADYEIIFKTHISPLNGRVAEGMWSYQIYLDGKCVVKDYFSVRRQTVQKVCYCNMI